MRSLQVILIAVVLVLVHPSSDALNEAPFSLLPDNSGAGSVLSIARFWEGAAQPPLSAVAQGAEASSGSVSAQRPAASWVSSPFSGPVANPPIVNFGVVEQGILYRSAQPTEAGYQWLLDNGFKSVVSLRRENGDDTSHVLGLGFRNYLWLSVEDETQPTHEDGERFLSFVTDSRNWPILIHCKVGLGRTGTMAALVRYAVDGWPMADALAEARVYRNGIDLVPGQVDWLNKWAAMHPPGSHRPAGAAAAALP